LRFRKKKKESEAAIALKLLKETEYAVRSGYSGSGTTGEKAGSTSLVLDSSFIENLVKNYYYTLKSIRQKLISESDKANEINKEYLRKIVSGAVKIVSEPEISMIRAKSVKKIVLLAAVVALFMAVFLAFFIEYIKNASKASSANKRT
jgi:uncharacterized protein involved in exopolysaccharide biosynthesis